MEKKIKIKIKRLHVAFLFFKLDVTFVYVCVKSQYYIFKRKGECVCEENCVELCYECGVITELIM